MGLLFYLYNVHKNFIELGQLQRPTGDRRSKISINKLTKKSKIQNQGLENEFYKIHPKLYRARSITTPSGRIHENVHFGIFFRNIEICEIM